MGSRFRVRHYNIKSKKLKSDKELKIIFLSDLHSRQYGKENERLLRAIRDEQPDLIFVGGDMLVGVRNTDPQVAISLAGALAEICPVYYANGNHEQRLKLYPDVYGNVYEEYKSALEDSGAMLLENECVSINAEVGQVSLYGLEIPAECYAKLRRTSLSTNEITERVGECPKEGYTILLAHNPKFADTYLEWGADLVLSGHLHGGVVRVPGIGGVISPQGILFPKYSGEHTKVGDADVVVSKGLGDHTIPIRIMNPKEIIVLHLSGI